MSAGRTAEVALTCGYQITTNVTAVWVTLVFRFHLIRGSDLQSI
jgi:hypothetical protein